MRLHRTVLLLWKPMLPLWMFFVISWPLVLLLLGTFQTKLAIPPESGADLQAK